MAELVLFILGGRPISLPTKQCDKQALQGTFCLPCWLSSPTIGRAPVVALMMLTHIMSTHVFTAIRPGPTTSSRIASVTLDTVPPPVSPSSRSKISNFARTYTSRKCRSMGAVGYASMPPGLKVHDFHGSAANPAQNGTLRHPDINLVLSHRAQEMYRRRLTHIGPATRHRICVAISSPRCLHVRTHSWGLSLPAVSPCRQQG